MKLIISTEMAVEKHQLSAVTSCRFQGRLRRDTAGACCALTHQDVFTAAESEFEDVALLGHGAPCLLLHSKETFHWYH